jgi:hypothetical protein
MTAKANTRTKQFLRRAAIERIHAFVRGKRLDNPYAKAVLLALTLYVDSDGKCFPSIDELAAVTEVSPATVRRRLDWLEEISVIERKPRWIGQNGVRTWDQRGKRTTDEIKLLLDADANHAVVGSDADCTDDWSAETGASPSPQVGQTLKTDHRALATGVTQPLHHSDPLISEPEPEESDLNLPSNNCSDDRQSFDMFEAVWFKPIARPSIAEKIWLSLTTSDQSAVIRAARGYVARLKARGGEGVPLAVQTFLRELRAWRQWLVPVRRTKATSSFAPAFVAEGSIQWRSRCVIADVVGKVRPVAIDSTTGRGCMMQPLPVHFLSLSQFADENPNSWKFVAAGEAHCNAWCDALNIAPRLITRGVRSRTLNGRTIPNWPIKEEGLRVPCLWPPDRPFPEPA